jgi:hypothetical protein
MKYIVEAPGGWYLYGTAFTGDKARAKVFDTVEAAQEAIKAAAKFSKPPIVKTWKVVPLT